MMAIVRLAIAFDSKLIPRMAARRLIHRGCVVPAAFSQ